MKEGKEDGCLRWGGTRNYTEAPLQRRGEATEGEEEVFWAGRERFRHMRECGDMQGMGEGRRSGNALYSFAGRGQGIGHNGQISGGKGR